jgi:hypothetical protein
MLLLPDSLHIDKITNPETLSYGKLNDCYSIVYEIIENLTPAGLHELAGGSAGDIDNLLSNLVAETYACVYGVGHEDAVVSKLGKFNSGSAYYLEKLTETVEDTLRQESLTYFILSVLPEFEMNWHHLEWGELITQYTYLNILAARDHGKSFFWSNAYALWRLWRYNRGSKRRDLSKNGREGYMFSFSATQAKRLMEIVKDTILEVPLLYEKLYPGKTKGWAETSIKCANGAKLVVRGMGASTRGAHPGWIVVDDGLKDNVIYSADQRRKTIDYFHSTIMNMILPKGPVYVVGTPFHANDLYGDLKTKKGWHVREYPSIFPDGKILWRSRYDYDDLVGKRDNQGSLIFSREHLCRPVTSDSTIFPFELLRRSTQGTDGICMVKNRESFPIKLVKVGMGCDFAMSSAVGADYSVFIVGGLDEFNNFWILNIIRIHGRTYFEQMSILRSLNLNFKPDVIYAEANQFQMVMAQSMEEEDMPVFPHTTTGKNKHDWKTGLPSLSVLFERGKMKIPTGDQYSRDMKDLIFSELSNIAWTDKGLAGVGSHDDIGMALWQLKMALAHGGNSDGFAFL